VTYQDQIVKLTQKAVVDLFDAATALSWEQLHWQPSPSARSAWNQLLEIAVGHRYLLPLIADFRSEAFQGHGASRESGQPEPANFDDLKKEALAGLAVLCQAISRLPEASLQDEVVLPFAGGMSMTLADVIALHYWNATYHLGQVNYISAMALDAAEAPDTAG